MKKSCFLLSLVVSLIIFQGCSTTSKIAFFEEKFNSDQEALVYVYRLKSMVGALVAWNVNLDNMVVASLRPGGYTVLRVSPGPHVVKIGESHTVVEALGEVIAHNPEAFMAKAHETYFVRSGGFGVEFAAKEKAMAELKAMKYEASQQAH
ncbi:MAG: DUF2846 domain-containing protein [Acidobacteriota bacterium]|nr:DUF2846 domain-containing protein [Acidobacteriota bacterium]